MKGILLLPALFAAPAAQTGMVAVAIETQLGNIEVEIDTLHARYGATFLPTSTPDHTMAANFTARSSRTISRRIRSKLK